MDVAGREPVPIARQAARTQAAGTSDHVPARVGARQGSYSRDLPEHHRMGTGPAWPAARGTPLFRSRTARADAGRDGLPSRDHPRADQIPEFIRARHAGAWAAFAHRRVAGEAAVGGCDRRGGISASARRTHRRGRRQAARMIRGEWKRAGGDRQSPLLVRFRLYCTPVGVISGV